MLGRLPAARPCCEEFGMDEEDCLLGLQKKKTPRIGRPEPCREQRGVVGGGRVVARSGEAIPESASCDDGCDPNGLGVC